MDLSTFRHQNDPEILFQHPKWNFGALIEYNNSKVSKIETY
jgi:hypothetical protein